MSRRQSRGFGLVELMVTITIMAIVSVIILARQDAFNGAILLRNQAYDIAFHIREVQLGAVAAVGEGGGFRSILGVEFDTAVANSGSYRVFEDNAASPNGLYDTGEAYGTQGDLDDRFEVRAIRVTGDTMTGTKLSVVFVRPNFDARFFDTAGEVNASSVEIDIARRGVACPGGPGTCPGVLRTVEVTETGQIAVQ